MANLQADDTTTGAYYPQHFAKSLFKVGEVAYGKCRATTINAIVRQVNMFGVTAAQVDAILQAEALYFLTSDCQHFWCDVHADHMGVWARVAYNGDGEICCTST